MILMKIAIVDSKYRIPARDLLTDIVTHTKFRIMDKEGNVILKGTKNDKKMQMFNDLISLGYIMQEQDFISYQGKREIDGIEVKILPAKTNYHSGTRIEVKIHGETEEEISRNRTESWNKIVKYLNNNGIPVDRICEESYVGCVYNTD
jgi:hypothetical protein